MAEGTPQERRTVFRVCTAGALIDVEINGVGGCALLDANSEGFAVVTDTRFKVGEEVVVTFRHEGTEYSGRAQVRNARPAERKRVRFGFQTGPREVMLRRGLRAVAIAAQRERLRREAIRRSTANAAR